MRSGYRHLTRAVLLAAIAFVTTVRPSIGSAASAADRAVLQAECGSCHMAYPARLLSVSAWSQVLGQLDRHYGVDATLDEASAMAVARALGAGQSNRPVSGGPLPRITTSAWFAAEHDELRRDVFRRASVKSASNCDACHRDAALGAFDEHDVHIPR